VGSNLYRLGFHVHKSGLLVDDRTGFRATGRTLQHPQHCSTRHGYLCICSCLRCVPVLSALCIAFVHSILFAIIVAFGPLFLGPLSELYGRSHVLQISNLWYLGICSLITPIEANESFLFTVWNLACGFAQSKNELIVFRFLAGLGGSAPLAIGGGVIGDLFDEEHRGQAIAIYSLAPLLGPVVAPVAGAWIAEKSTWRWVVRALTSHMTHTTALTITK
jgi:MFS family permease